MCVQQPNESFSEFWARKLSKARECELDRIQRDDVLLLELIRGVSDPKLKEEFLRQRNPTLDGLKAIAEQWQSASYVSKSLNPESESVNIYKTSSTYKSEKFNNWKRDRNEQNSTRNISRCTRCNNTDCKSREECFARDKTCFKCGRVGHLEVVCRDRNSRSHNRDSTKRRDPTPHRSIRFNNDSDDE